MFYFFPTKEVRNPEGGLLLYRDACYPLHHIQDNASSYGFDNVPGVLVVADTPVDATTIYWQSYAT